MKRKIMTIIFILAVVFAISACQPPRTFCFNEPIIVNGQHVDQIECVHQAYPGRG